MLRSLASQLKSNCLQLEKYLEHTSVTIITQQELVWQPMTCERWTMWHAWASLSVHVLSCIARHPVAVFVKDFIICQIYPLLNFEDVVVLENRLFVPYEFNQTVNIAFYF